MAARRQTLASSALPGPRVHRAARRALPVSPGLSARVASQVGRVLLAEWLADRHFPAGWLAGRPSRAAWAAGRRFLAGWGVDRPSPAERAVGRSRPFAAWWAAWGAARRSPVVGPAVSGGAAQRGRA